MEENDISVYSFFSCLDKVLDCRQMKSEIWTYRCITKSELLICLLISCSLTNFLWIQFTIPMFNLLNLHTVLFRQYEKKYCILKCSKFKNLTLFPIHLSFKTQSSLYAEFSGTLFSNKYLKTLHWQLYWDNWNVSIYFPLPTTARELSQLENN